MRTLLALGLAAVLAAPALAHHGWGSYDADNPITMQGPILSITLQNPHGEMTMRHAEAEWLVTLAPLSRMAARGATGDILADGVEVIAYGYPKRDGTPEIRAEWVEVDGRRFQLR